MAERSDMPGEETVQGLLTKVLDQLTQFRDANRFEPESLGETIGHINRALAISQSSMVSKVMRRWAALLYIALTGLAEVFFIELYCRWHGAVFISPNLFSPENIQILTNIDFVGGPTPMSITAEVLMWSSLGVWAQRVFGMVRRYTSSEPNLPIDMATYIGLLGRNVTIAAIVVIVLVLADFSIFNISIKTFETVIAIAFVLGVFGDETFAFLEGIRGQILPGRSRGGSPPNVLG